MYLNWVEWVLKKIELNWMRGSYSIQLFKFYTLAVTLKAFNLPLYSYILFASFYILFSHVYASHVLVSHVLISSSPLETLCKRVE
jgi:hypothetical protein